MKKEEVKMGTNSKYNKPDAICYCCNKHFAVIETDGYYIKISKTYKFYWFCSKECIDTVKSAVEKLIESFNKNNSKSILP